MYRDRDWLLENYVKKERTMEQIGKQFGVTGNSVRYHIKKFGLEREGSTKNKANMEKAKILKNYEWLYKQYITLNKSYDMIAKEFGVGKTTVARWVKKHGLEKNTKTSGLRENEGPKQLIECAYCGQETLVKWCRVQENSRRFCSKTCSALDSYHNLGGADWLAVGKSKWLETDEGKLFMREHGARTYANQAKAETNIERKLAEILTSGGIRFETQKKMYYWCVDFYLIDYDIVIEAQGDYWHANPAKYPNPNEMQRKNIRRDKGKAAYISKCGHGFLAFWETDIMKNPDKVIEEIRRIIMSKEAIA